VHRQANPEERAALDALGQVSESASFRAMARTSEGKTALIEVKAVDEAYPHYGEVSIREPVDAGQAWRFPGVILAERSLLDRLLEVGALSIGDAVTVGGTPAAGPLLTASPGPLLISRETLTRPAIQPGSLIR
jgi:putative ABC transport system permease protein